jgi:hypothetical protein
MRFGDLQPWIAAFVLLAALSPAVRAHDYFVDPVFGSQANDGSRAAPWKSIQAVIDDKPLLPGDTLFLRSGEHGFLMIRDRRNTGPITIGVEAGHAPRLTGMRLISSSNWRFRSLELQPSTGPVDARSAIVEIEGESDNITIDTCMISSAKDITQWTDADWRQRAYHGVFAAGNSITLRNNKIKNVKHAIHIMADFSIIERNTIENFGGDGIRGLGNHSTYQSNTIKNCYKIDENHDDGFQSWSRGLDGTPGTGSVFGGVLRGNRIINYEDPVQPLRCTLQGIGMFDGMFVDWVIENNVVMTDHWHGITVMGAHNVRIVNNTVIDLNNTAPGPPWISITHHKDGRAPKNSVIANNLSLPRAAHKSNQFGLPKPGVSTLSNIELSDPPTFFADPGRNDLRLRSGSPAIDAGTTLWAPSIDIDGTRRPQGAGVDVGAYEALPRDR